MIETIREWRSWFVRACAALGYAGIPETPRSWAERRSTLVGALLSREADREDALSSMTTERNKLRHAVRVRQRGLRLLEELARDPMLPDDVARQVMGDVARSARCNGEVAVVCEVRA